MSKVTICLGLSMAVFLGCSNEQEREREPALSDWIGYATYHPAKEDVYSISGNSVCEFIEDDSIYHTGRRDVAFEILQDTPVTTLLQDFASKVTETTAFPASLKIGDYYLGGYDKYIKFWDTMKLEIIETWKFEQDSIVTFTFYLQNPPSDAARYSVYCRELGFIESCLISEGFRTIMFRHSDPEKQAILDLISDSLNAHVRADRERYLRWSESME